MVPPQGQCTAACDWDIGRRGNERNERDNASLKGVLPKDYARPGLDKQRLTQLINLVSDIGLGSPADRSRDTLGRVYEYFLAQFASAEGNSTGGVLSIPRRIAGYSSIPRAVPGSVAWSVVQRGTRPRSRC
jgi:N-6 DNA Methylase